MRSPQAIDCCERRSNRFMSSNRKHCFPDTYTNQEHKCVDDYKLRPVTGPKTPTWIRREAKALMTRPEQGYTALGQTISCDVHDTAEQYSNEDQVRCSYKPGRQGKSFLG